MDDLKPDCHRHILKVSEQQSDDVKLDRQLFLACAQELNRLCTNIPSGAGQAYKCLMHHRHDRTMGRGVGLLNIAYEQVLNFIFTVRRTARQAAEINIC